MTVQENMPQIIAGINCPKNSNFFNQGNMMIKSKALDRSLDIINVLLSTNNDISLVNFKKAFTMVHNV